MFIRTLMVMLAIAVGVRLIFILLMPVMPYLAVALIAWTVFRIVSWWRNRW